MRDEAQAQVVKGSSRDPRAPHCIALSGSSRRGAGSAGPLSAREVDLPVAPASVVCGRAAEVVRTVI